VERDALRSPAAGGACASVRRQVMIDLSR